MYLGCPGPGAGAQSPAWWADHPDAVAVADHRASCGGSAASWAAVASSWAVGPSHDAVAAVPSWADPYDAAAAVGAVVRSLAAAAAAID